MSLLQSSFNKLVGIVCPLSTFPKSDSNPTPNTFNLLPKLSLIHLKGGLCMHALYDEVDCLNDRVVTMVADKMKRQYLRGSSFGIQTILEYLLEHYNCSLV